MKYIGGYSILDLTDANVSVQANACYNQDKPVLVYGANGERYFADTITKSGTSIIITKGGKTITIANDNTITNVGNIQNHQYRINFNGYINSDAVDFYMNVTTNKKLTKDLILENPDLLDNCDYLPIIEVLGNITGNNFAFENFYIEDNKLECNVYVNGEEQGFDVGTCVISDVHEFY